jgi:hypothetical protein
MVSGGQLGAEQGAKTLLFGLLHKSDRPVQSIRIGQGHSRKSAPSGRAAERFQ